MLLAVAVRPAAAWVFGALMGLAVIATLYVGRGFMLTFPVAVALALVFVFASRQPAMGGGLLLALGVWMTYGHFSMLQRCAAMNSATGSCTVVDASGTAVPAIAFALAGALVSLYCVAKAKQQDGQAPRSGA
jgi:hypothetical protein